MSAEEVTYFREVQKFNQWWFQAIVLLTTAFIWYSAIVQLVYGKPVGDDPMSDNSMIVMWLAFGILFPVFMNSLRLVVEVRNNGLYFQFYPFHFSFKHTPFDEIKNYQARDYRPLRDYGGWGVRYGLGGKAYTTSGSRGVLFEFSNGKRLMLGSQKADEFAAAMSMAIDTVD